MANSRSSHFRTMRILVMYDLPTISKTDIKIYTIFRKKLMNRGFIMLQESVYIKQCQNPDAVTKNIIYIEKIIPEKGDIRMLCITEKQYQDMKILRGFKSFNEKLNDKGTLLHF